MQICLGNYLLIFLACFCSHRPYSYIQWAKSKKLSLKYLLPQKPIHQQQTFMSSGKCGSNTVLLTIYHQKKRPCIYYVLHIYSFNSYIIFCTFAEIKNVGAFLVSFLLEICMTCQLTVDFAFSSGALHRRMTDFNAAIDDYLLAMDKTDHEESNSTYKEAQRQLLLCYNDFAVECFRSEQLRTMPSKQWVGFCSKSINLINAPFGL